MNLSKFQIDEKQTIKLTCVGCKKVVAYSIKDREGLEKRISKSGLNDEEFVSTFKCRACGGNSKTEIKTKKQKDPEEKIEYAKRLPASSKHLFVDRPVKTNIPPDIKIDKSNKIAVTIAEIKSDDQIVFEDGKIFDIISVEDGIITGRQAFTRGCSNIYQSNQQIYRIINKVETQERI